MLAFLAIVGDASFCPGYSADVERALHRMRQVPLPGQVRFQEPIWRAVCYLATGALTHGSMPYVCTRVDGSGDVGNSGAARCMGGA